MDFSRRKFIPIIFIFFSLQRGFKLTDAEQMGANKIKENFNRRTYFDIEGLVDFYFLSILIHHRQTSAK